jgi:hypothetical protein
MGLLFLEKNIFYGKMLLYLTPGSLKVTDKYANG